MIDLDRRQQGNVTKRIRESFMDYFVNEGQVPCQSNFVSSFFYITLYTNILYININYVIILCIHIFIKLLNYTITIYLKMYKYKIQTNIIDG